MSKAIKRDKHHSSSKPIDAECLESPFGPLWLKHYEEPICAKDDKSKSQQRCVFKKKRPKASSKGSRYQNASCRPLAGSLGALGVAQKTLLKKQDEIIDTFDIISDVLVMVGEIAGEALTEKIRRAVADMLYWCVPRTALGIDAILVLLNLETFEPRPYPTGIRCTRCNEILRARSRSHLKDIREYEKRYDRGILCDNCRESEMAVSAAAYEEATSDTEIALEELKNMPYADYLTTEHWKSIRRKAMSHASYHCQLCNNSKETLHVHHRTYERRGEEWLSDLIVLCENCHKKFHDKVK